MFCKRLAVKMMVKVCKQRQEMVTERRSAYPDSVSLTACENCPEGELARAGKLNDDDINGIMNKKREEMAMAEGQRSEDRDQKSEKTKTCAKCKVPKPADHDHFSPDPKMKDGLRSYCKPCTAELSKKYQAKAKASAVAPAGGDDKPVTVARVAKGKGKKILKVAEGRIDRPSPPVGWTLTEFIDSRALVINFADYPELLAEFREKARLNFRTVDMQILWTLSMAVIWEVQALAFEKSGKGEAA